MHELLTRIREKRPNAFDTAITAVIVLAAVLVGLETDPRVAAEHGALLHRLDVLVVAIFVGELALKIALEGRRPWRYFASKEPASRTARRFDLERVDFWHVFDFAIVVGSVVPMFQSDHAHAQLVPLFRLVRVLRMLRLAEEVPQLHVLVGALLRSLPSIAYIFLFMGLHFYAYAVVGTTLFVRSDPAHFGSLGAAMLTLFEVLTGNGFSSLMHDAIDRAPAFRYAGWVPVAYFASFVVVGVTIILNLFVGVITAEVNTVKNILAEREAARARALLDEREAEILDHVRTLERQLDSIKDSFKRLAQLRAPEVARSTDAPAPSAVESRS